VTKIYQTLTVILLLGCIIFSAGNVKASTVSDAMGIETYVIISNKAFVDTTTTPLLLTGPMMIWPGELIHVQYANGNATYFDKSIYQPTAINFVDGATLIITNSTGNVIFKSETYVDNIENEWKYRLGNGPNSIVINAVASLLCACIFMLAIFYKYKSVILGDEKQCKKAINQLPEKKVEQ
jgi:hypothetical protein